MSSVAGDCVICEDEEMVCTQHPNLETATFIDPNSIFKSLTINAKEAVVIRQLEEILFLCYEIKSFESNLFPEDGDDELMEACHTLINHLNNRSWINVKS
tara:strand:- start:1691 stop:1990 length:300 start_codon:yes stop_codon:yes gene_type:complete